MSESSTTTQSIMTKSDGCVKCEGTVKCPVCGENEYCVMTSLTCQSCPYTYCAPTTNQTLSGLLSHSSNTTSITSTHNNDTTVHKIVGGVIGTVAGLVLIVLLVWYSFYLRKRNALAKANVMGQDKNFNANDIEGLEMDDIEDEEDLYDTDDDDDDDDEEEQQQQQQPNIKTINSVITSKNSNVSMTPQQYANELRSMHPHANNSLFVAGDRMSTASTVRTGASNILPIGYIPGVTSGGGTMNSSNHKNHLNIVGDIRSHITLGSSILDGGSFFGDDNTEDNASSALQRPTVDRRTKPVDSITTSSLTTAIKGSKPKLVQINEEDEQETPVRMRNSVSSDASGTGSYILDFEIDSSTAATPTRPQPPIPAASNSSNITTKSNNRLSRLTAISTRDDVVSTTLSDMITIDTKAIDQEEEGFEQRDEGALEQRDQMDETVQSGEGTDTPDQNPALTTLDPFSDDHKI
ncbi:protein Opy2p [Monosporozyma servazzii]